MPGGCIYGCKGDIDFEIMGWKELVVKYPSNSELCDKLAAAYEAAWGGQKDAVELLLSQGADVAAKDKNGRRLNINYPKYQDNRITARVIFEFPHTICEVISRHQGQLSDLIAPLNWEYHVEAGYDIVPNGCSFASPEQGDFFQGNNLLPKVEVLYYLGCQEMVWVTQKPKNLSEIVDQGNEDLKEAYVLMKQIAETVHSPVGLLDIATQLVFAYDAKTMTLDTADISLCLKFLRYRLYVTYFK